MHMEDFFSGTALELVKRSAAGDVAGVGRSVAAGVSSNAPGEAGMTPLIWTAFIAQNKPGTQALLQHGADPNQASENRVTPMELAAQAKDIEYLRLFLKFNGNPNLRNATGEEPLIFSAAYENNWEHVWLLITSGADINAHTPLNKTTMLLAAKLNHYEQVYKLLQRGADYRLKTPLGESVPGYTFGEDLEKGSDNQVWQQKCRDWFREHGVAGDG